MCYVFEQVIWMIPLIVHTLCCWSIVPCLRTDALAYLTTDWVIHHISWWMFRMVPLISDQELCHIYEKMFQMLWSIIHTQVLILLFPLFTHMEILVPCIWVEVPDVPTHLTCPYSSHVPLHSGVLLHPHTVRYCSKTPWWMFWIILLYDTLLQMTGGVLHHLILPTHLNLVLPTSSVS